jgi:homoserine O-acetyltransferase
MYPGYVRSMVAIAVGGRHTAWQIGLSEAQRQAIYADARWQGGRYAATDPPAQGLAAARMMAMTTYRSHASFGMRFGRDRMPTALPDHAGDGAPGGDAQAPDAKGPFAVESYLRYQGDKLIERFDAMCYVRLTELMDTHDVARDRGAYPDALRAIEQPALVLGIDSDVLYPLAEQEELATHLPHATLGTIRSPHGHDAFLIEFDQMTEQVAPWLAAQAPAEATTGTRETA